MNKSCLAYVIGLLTFAIAALGEHKDSAPLDYPYSAAFISTISAPAGHTELVVFPMRGKAFKIPIRSANATTFSPDGRALYGMCTPYRDQEREREPVKIVLCKIDLYRGSTTPVPGIAGDHVPHLANNVLSSAPLLILGLTLPDGNPTSISLPKDGYPWTHLSLSPDGGRAIATHNGRVELIDILHNTTKPFDDRYFIAAWSPDGKWLAAVEEGEYGRTILFDATTLKQQRILGNSELDWSPDSRFLLGVKKRDRCGPYYGTLEAIDIVTGNRTTIESSKCQVNQATTGWVRSDIRAR
jgi:WD40 repeat protein